MILICPSCQTRYYTSEAALGPAGRNVRCASCQHSWFAKPSQTLDPKAPPAEESGLTREQVERLRQKAVENVKTGSGPHAELREKQAKRRKRLRYAAAGAAWVICGATFAGGAMATISLRQSVVEAWPKAASVYSIMGMPVNRFGLEFGPMKARRSFDGTTPVLTISGEATNVSDRHRPSPVVRIELRNEYGAAVHEEYVGLLDTVVGPGEKSTYTAHIVSPPMDSFDVHVSFESPKDVPSVISEPSQTHDANIDTASHYEEEAYADPAHHESENHMTSDHGGGHEVESLHGDTSRDTYGGGDEDHGQSSDTYH